VPKQRTIQQREAFGIALKAKIESVMTVADFVRRSGFDRSAVQGWFRGAITPSDDSLERIAGALGCPALEIREMLRDADSSNASRVERFDVPAAVLRAKKTPLWSQLSTESRAEIARIDWQGVDPGDATMAALMSTRLAKEQGKGVKSSPALEPPPRDPDKRAISKKSRS
jgi:transcriptional regulator with XRE-family HTH domain